jgi:small membrane protein
VAIADPMITVRIARAIGIERGTDLVVYTFALAFLGTSFFFYSRLVRMQRQITELVRHIAIREAEHRPPPGPG